MEVKVTNPITYIKNWWSKVIKNEGIDFRLRIRPLTAVAIAVAIATVSFGVGRFVLPEGINIPFFKYEATKTATPTPTINEIIWKETAFTGTLRFSNETQKYYLVTTSSEAITLDMPENFNMADFVGKRIFAAGMYNKQQRVLKVSDAKNTEVLPKSPMAIPTLTPTPIPSPTPFSTPIPSPTQP